jgi:hypothetical protein
MWRFAAARATGTSHLKAGLPCQDRIACKVTGNKTHIFAVADGAGSAVQAEQGAEIAVNTVIECLQQAIDGGGSDYPLMLNEAAIHGRMEVASAAHKLGLKPRDLASTLLVTVVGPNGGGALQIGDGVIVISYCTNEWRWVFWPQRGEYANTTHFLTDADALEHIQIESLGNIIDVAIMTDGMQSLALHYASRSVHHPFFSGIFQPLLETDGDGEITNLSASLQLFLSSMRVGSRTDDDVSLIMATCRQQDHQP